MFKITGIQLNPIIGDIVGNFQKMKTHYLENQDSDLLVFTELSLMGYFPADLLDDKKLIDFQIEKLKELVKLTKNSNTAMLFGAVTKNTGKGKPLHNSAILAQNGKINMIYNKQLLPTYNVFDEARYFNPGDEPGIFTLKKDNGEVLNIATLICEDGWERKKDTNYTQKKTPFQQLKDVSSFVDLVISLNSSPSSLDKIEARKNVFEQQARLLKKPLFYLNQVGGNDEIVFDGNSFLLEANGNSIIAAKAFKESSITFGYDNGKIIDTEDIGNKFSRNTNKMEIIINQLNMGLKDYLDRCGFDKVVVGCSGGIDSAVTLALAVRALGPENVTAITMPGPFSSDGSVNDSIALCNNLQVKLLTHPITKQYDTEIGELSRTLRSFTGDPRITPDTLTRENLQARIRGQVLMAFSNHTGAMVLSTGNKSEMAIGYSTLYGDMNGGLNLLGDLYKTDVFELAENLSEIPRIIINKPPSAELSEDQLDSDSLPPYELLDAYLKLSLENKNLSWKEKKEAKKIATNLSEGERKILDKRIAQNEFKRRQAPPIIKIREKAFGVGRRMPIACKIGIEDKILQNKNNFQM